MESTGAYILTDKKTKKFYVGSSFDVEKRIDRHVHDLNSGKHHCLPFQKIWNENSKLVVTFFPTATRDDAYILEQDIIDRNLTSANLLNIGLGVKGGDTLSRNPNKENILARIKDSCRKTLNSFTDLEKKLLYGRSGNKNGMWGKTHTPEARKKMSEINLGISRRGYGFKLSDKQRKQISEAAKLRVGNKNSFYGKHHSVETKTKLSEKRKAMKLIPTNARKVMVSGIEYVSLTEASRQLKIAPALMVYRLKSKKPLYQNYQYVV